ncbi:MAG: tetratricopeptide repeat protein [Flavobacteriales bacterium]|nr:tetratricopeptide repeat protein [Flavobacteriales bacterium]
MAANAADTVTADALYELSIEHLGRDGDRAKEFADRSIALSERIGYGLGVAKGHVMLAAVAEDKGQLPLALEHYELSHDKSVAIGDSIGIAQTLGNSGSVLARMGDMPKALERFIAARKLNHALGRKDWEANNLSNIGNVQKNLGRLDEGLRYLRESEKLSLESGDVAGVASARSNIATVLYEQGQFPEALRLTGQALEGFRTIGYANGEMRALGNMADIRLRMGDGAGALHDAQEALRMAGELGDPSGTAQAHITLGRAHLLAKRYDDAGRELRQGVTDASASDSWDLLLNAYLELSRVDSARGDHAAALAWFKRTVAAKDSLYNASSAQDLMRQKMQFDFDRKEELDRAEQEKKDALSAAELRRQKLLRNGSLFGLALMVAFAGVFLFQRVRIGRERARSEALLLNILPSEVAEELKAKGEAEAVQIDLVTVLFTDFKGFTAMSEHMSPKDLVRDLNECFSAFDRITEKHGIEKIKTIGDAYMAAGGLPTPNTTHVTDVMKAALEMRDFIAEGKARKVAAGLPYFEIRIGIHTGPVVAGIVGVKKFSYDIWGDTVNTASRMESSGEVGQVNISEATYALVKDEPGLTFTPRGKVQAKGKGEMEMYFVEWSV